MVCREQREHQTCQQQWSKNAKSQTKGGGVMNIDNEKLFKALDNIAYVNRSDNFMMLPETQEDEMPFLLSQLQQQLQRAVDNYAQKPENKERVEFFRLVK